MIEAARESEVRSDSAWPRAARLALPLALAALIWAWWPLVETGIVASDAAPLIEEIETRIGEPLTEANWFNHVDATVFEGNPIEGRVLYWYPWRALMSVALATFAAFAIAAAGWRSKRLAIVAAAAPIATLLGWLGVAVGYGPTIRVVTMIIE